MVDKNYDKLISNLKFKFTENDIVTKENISKEYLNVYSIYNSKSFNNVLSRLKRNNLLIRLSKDNYIFKKTKDLDFKLDLECEKIYKIIKDEYPLIDISVWNTQILNRFMIHQVYNNMVIVEVDKLILESVIPLLKENIGREYAITVQDILEKKQAMYLNSEKILSVKVLIKKSPLNKAKTFSVPKMEKILVDLFIDKMYIAYQGQELITIYEEVISNYNIDFVKLYAYAKRRNKNHEIRRYINKLNINDLYKLGDKNDR
ncbi:MAG: hypothetical protein PHD15_01810 [Clostridia bacterium]|nr:hypothetical protein [Clostridia bacterium]MDD4386487.1 hypothetical protein [Clostridia bacterium]